MKRSIHTYDRLLPDNANTAISRDCGLSMQAELAYLSQFVRCYRPSLQLFSIQHYPMYILEDRKQRLGISFFCPELPKERVFPGVVAEMPDLQESWLVLAPGHPARYEGHLACFISSYHPASGFDAIFLFDYLKSTIQIIK